MTNVSVSQTKTNSFVVIFVNSLLSQTLEKLTAKIKTDVFDEFVSEAGDFFVFVVCSTEKLEENLLSPSSHYSHSRIFSTP